MLKNLREYKVCFNIVKQNKSFMKAIVNKPAEKEQKIKYPCLMEHKPSGLVVLFTEPKTGTVLNKSQYFSFGAVSKTWDMESFTLFTDSITLSNG